MRLLVHQFKVEFYSLRWVLLAWAVIFAIISWLELSAWGADLRGGVWSHIPIYATTVNVTVGGCLFLLTVLTQVRDLFLDKRAQWHTRPMPAITLYGAKALLVLVCVVVPVSFLFCMVYMPIAGWELTGLILLEVWGWSLCVILCVTFLNVQYSWIHSFVCFGFIGGGVLILEKLEITLYHDSAEWILCYALLVLVVCLGLLYLALFRGKKHFPLWPCWCVCVVLSFLHAVPLNKFFTKTTRFNLLDFDEYKVAADVSVTAKRSYGTSSSSLRKGCASFFL